MATSGIGSSFSNVSLTTNAQERAQKLMKQMDTDADGKVSKQEFTAFGENMKAKGPRPPSGGQGAAPQGANAPTPPSADDMFAKADTDGDGSLSIENLSAMMSQHETHAAARGGQAGGPPAGGGHGGSPPGGPPAGGGHGGGGAHAGGGRASASSSSSSASSDPADTDHDGTVSAAEKLVYELSHVSDASDTSES
jgi:EF hand